MDGLYRYESDGSKIDAGFWYIGRKYANQPNGINDHCVGYFSENDAKWFDHSCSKKAMSICEAGTHINGKHGCLYRVAGK